MSSASQPPATTNNTVKLSTVLRRRVELAMALEGYAVWSEFCRVALTEKCQAVEERLRQRDEPEYRRLYGRRADEAAQP